ncbi:NAD(P)-dependent oxidoreductase [Enemella sp. A6]|uniref:NAD(P)-dependent oxidoreductase n=1 Tax=Enemella sp. A6 TaxID=3440152 RepID=UPI003EBEEC32
MSVTVLSQVGPLDQVEAQFPDVTVIQVPPNEKIPDDVRGAVLFTPMRATQNLAEVLDRGVEWIHLAGTGIDGFRPELVTDQVVTCSRGATATWIAEWVVAQILAFEKRLPDAWATEPPERWGTPALGGLAGKKVALVGFGSIGQAVAARLLPFEVQLSALRRSDGPSGMDGVQSTRSVAELLDRASHVVLAAPGTPETQGMVNADFLAHLPEGAHLVNVARGSLIDEDALRRALDSGRLAAASLDVADPEPLPAGHWFYDHPKVRFSAHVSWSGPRVWDNMQRTFVDNLERWIAGDPLQNVVDFDRGY